MIASAQKTIRDVPWYLFRKLAEKPQTVPCDCFVLAGQLPFLPRGFLYACQGDVLPQGQQHTVQMRVGFSIHHLHFVVVIPMIAAERVVRSAGLHLPIWPLDLEKNRRTL